MANLEELKPILKDKWLDYYEVNRDWIKLMVTKHWWNLPNNQGRRPDSAFILGVISALEPKIQEILFYSFTISGNRDDMVYGLGLNFDPEKELEKRLKERAARETSQYSSPLDDIRQKLTQEN